MTATPNKGLSNDDVISQALDAAAYYIDRLRTSHSGRPVRDMQEAGEAYYRLAGEARLLLRHKSSEGADGWQPISTARKDGTIIWALLRDDIFPGLLPNRDDLKRWNGLQVPLRHPGVYTEVGREWDPGWNIAAPVMSSGGFPDEWISGWRPLPSGAMT